MLKLKTVKRIFYGGKISRVNESEFTGEIFLFQLKIVLTGHVAGG